MASTLFLEDIVTTVLVEISDFLHFILSMVMDGGLLYQVNQAFHPSIHYPLASITTRCFPKLLHYNYIRTQKILYKDSVLSTKIQT